MQKIMDERGIDRTSVIALALYILDVYMSREETRSMNLSEILDDLRAKARKDMPSFVKFSWGSKYRKNQELLRRVEEMKRMMAEESSEQ